MNTSLEKTKTSPRDFFLYLGVIVTLYISTISLINLIFDTINAAFPDALNYYVDPYSGSLRLSIASLIIIFPLFLFLSWLSNKDIRLSPEKTELGIRKWLTYLTLFLAGIAIVSDLVTLINTFLNGEITTRFVLKVIALLIIAGFVFWYYFSDLRKGSGVMKKKPYAVIAVFIVLASIVVGFSIIGSPTATRQRRFDDRRLNDVQNIKQQVITYWQQKASLPKTLADISTSLSYDVVPSDPETNAPYEYIIKAPTSFSICAHFDRSNFKEATQNNLGYNQGLVKHFAGRNCFDTTIDPQVYSIIKNPSAPSGTVPARPVK